MAAVIMVAFYAELGVGILSAFEWSFKGTSKRFQNKHWPNVVPSGVPCIGAYAEATCL